MGIPTNVSLFIWSPVRAPMGIPRVWAVERDHMVPLGKREPHWGGLVVVFLSSSVVVSVATTGTPAD